MNEKEKVQPTTKFEFLAGNNEELNFWLQYLQFKSNQFIKRAQNTDEVNKIEMERQVFKEKRHSVEQYQQQSRASVNDTDNELPQKQELRIGSRLIRAHSVADLASKPKQQNYDQSGEHSTQQDATSSNLPTVMTRDEQQLRRQTSVELVKPKGSKRPVYKIIDSKTYQSQTLWRGESSMEGIVLKERKNELALLVGRERYQDRIIALDFDNRVLRVRPTSKPYYDASKDVQFHQIINVRKVSLDIYKREHLLRNFKSKFVVVTLKRQFILFAKDPVEREIWVEAFCRVIDFNSSGVYDSTKPSKRYLNLVQEQKNDKTSAKYNVLDSKVPQKGLHDGIETYKSNFLEVNNLFVKGALMKRIQNRKVYHDRDFHQKHYELNFNEGRLKVYKYSSDDIPEKFYQYTEIRACFELSELQVAQLNEKAEQKRSSSLLRRMVTKQSQGCKWNFAFELELSDRSLELYAPTRIDREKWVNVFQTVAEMNSKLVSMIQITPFQYQKETQNALANQSPPRNKKREQIEEFDLTSGAKTKIVKGKPEMQMSGEVIHKYVESWLQKDSERKDDHEEIGIEGREGAQDSRRDRLIDQEKMMSRNRQRKHLESFSQDQHTHRAMDGFVEFYSPSCSLTFRYIEGYLLKEIEGESRQNPLKPLHEISRKDKFHLRFFRIVFNQGRLCLKTDRPEKKMRSFALDSLLSACSVNSSEEIYLDQDQGQYIQTLAAHYQSEHLETSKKQPLLQKSELISRFQIDERSYEPAWKYCFKISFPERKFLLYAASRKEMDTWLRVFKLIIAMNHQKVDMFSKNLFVFESQIQQSKLSSQISKKQASVNILNEFSDQKGIRDKSEESDQTAGKAKAEPLDESTLNQQVVDFGVDVKTNEVKVEASGVTDGPNSTPQMQQPAKAQQISEQQLQDKSKGNTIVNQNITVKNVYKIKVQANQDESQRDGQIQLSGQSEVMRSDHEQKARKTLLRQSHNKRERPMTAKSSRTEARQEQIGSASKVYQIQNDNQREKVVPDSQKYDEFTKFSLVKVTQKPQINSFFEDQKAQDQDGSSVTPIMTFQSNQANNLDQNQQTEHSGAIIKERVEQVYNLRREQRQLFPQKVSGTTKSQMINNFALKEKEKPERTISRKKIKLVKSTASLSRPDLNVSSTTEGQGKGNMLLLKGFQPAKYNQIQLPTQNKNQIISASNISFTPIKAKPDLSKIMSKEAQERLKNIIQSQTSQGKAQALDPNQQRSDVTELSQMGQSQVSKKRVIRIIKNKKTGEQIDRSVIEKSISRIKLNQQSTEDLASLTPILNRKAKEQSLIQIQQDDFYGQKARNAFDAAFSRSKSVIHHQSLPKQDSINFYENHNNESQENKQIQTQVDEIQRRNDLKINILGHLQPSHYNFSGQKEKKINQQAVNDEEINFENFTSNPPVNYAQYNIMPIHNDSNLYQNR